MKKTSTGRGEEAAGTRIQSVARASRLLLWVAQQRHGVSAKEIALSQGLALPTAYHLVNTLVDQGLLSKDPNRRYGLGHSAAIIAQAYLRGRSVSETLLVAVRKLAETTGETAYLADWGENDIRVLASVEGTDMVRVAEVTSGPYEHGHARANGKLLLAYATPELRESYLRTHPQISVTSKTIADREELDRELERIRKRGYAYDREEYSIGVSCVAAPLLQDGQLVAAFALAVPTERFKRNRRALTDLLLDLVAETKHRVAADVEAVAV